MIRRKTKERPFGATDERENVILSEACHSGAEGDRIKRSRRISICMLLTAFLSACTDYAAKMEDDFEEWKASREFSEPAEETLSSSGATLSSSSVTVQSSSSETSVSSSSEKAESSSSKVPEPAEGSMTDARDGQTYRTVVIGSQIWMAQNLNYEAENSLCYNDDPAHCATYGRLYTWAAATTACPSGWHLPSKEEFETLFTAVGGIGTAGEKLKSTNGWNSSGNGTDAYVFSALPAGFRNNNGYYYYEGNVANFWSSTEHGSNDAYDMYLDYENDSANLYSKNKFDGFSVRCLKDYEQNLSSSGATPSSSSVTVQSSSSETSVSSSSEKVESSSSKVLEPTEGSMTDARDSQTYRTVVVGSQIWMAQNLNYEAENSLCYNDDPAHCATYGRLYTWAAATTACPSGWHLPSKEEFETLFTAVGGIGTAGVKLKSTNGWISIGNGTDAYVFSALPAGGRDNNGNYLSEGLDAYFWSSTESNSYYAYYMGLNYKGDSAYLNNYDKGYGYPVRCIMD
ncbi:fibrobacter succinogenes major paralogous domain-containing protein [uncultured Fibrobacter sp.]|uniref:fibrobacter succinogenes major paralogous domain-containing protein n=1 Tax=uncultured Fibrobacter sp. TaxID=261512 RepID=UPI00261D7361|nr:fibrobacter succinogenes major paralogous domain-containing protein [uncultured Fibrobacter sp.]